MKKVILLTGSAIVALGLVACSTRLERTEQKLDRLQDDTTEYLKKSNEHYQDKTLDILSDSVNHLGEAIKK